MMSGEKNVAAITPIIPTKADIRRTRACPRNMLAPATPRPTTMASSAVRVWVPISAAPAPNRVSRAVQLRTADPNQSTAVQPSSTPA